VRVQAVTLTLGAVLTLAGAALLVVAFRHGQAGRVDDERRIFRLAVGGLAAGSLLFLVTTVMANPLPA
jgi:VIT1/CCC1 family predicted Fe2+/Mn2+ transporter